MYSPDMGRGSGIPAENGFGGNMLILTRRPGESLYLGDGIKLKILSVQGKQIKIGLDVPEDRITSYNVCYTKLLRVI